MRFAVTIVSPPNYAHAEAFAEVAQTLHAGLRALGHEAVLTRKWTAEKHRRTIVLGANLLAALQAEPPPGAILYNLEQIEAGSEWLSPALLSLFRRFTVWDYSPQNAEALVALGVPRPAHLPISYTPSLSRVRARAEDLDVLFYGAINERRRQVLQALRARGLSVEALHGVYGEARDAFIARAKVVLNLHYYSQAKVFEAVRVSYLLANRKAVVSETGLPSPDETDFAPGVAFTAYDGLVDRCCALVADEPARRALGQAGLEVMKRRDVVPALRRVLEGLAPPQGRAA